MKNKMRMIEAVIEVRRVLCFVCEMTVIKFSLDCLLLLSLSVQYSLLFLNIFPVDLFQTKFLVFLFFFLSDGTIQLLIIDPKYFFIYRFQLGEARMETTAHMFSDNIDQKKKPLGLILKQSKNEK